MLDNDKMTTPKGGPRTGAGRKPKHGTSKPGRTVRMLPETWDRLRGLSVADACSDSETIERLLRRALKLSKLQTGDNK
jgi:hypothetical protein